MLLRPLSHRLTLHRTFQHIYYSSMPSPSSPSPPPSAAPTSSPSSTRRPLPPDLTTLVCTTPSEIERCMALRYEVFVQEQGYPEELKLNNEKDLDSAHLLLHSPTTHSHIATVRLFLPEMKLGRLAVARAWRGSGAGRRMVQALEEAVRSGEVGAGKGQGEREVRVKAHVQRGLVGFYEACGYRLEGGEFDEDGVPHLMVVKTIVMDG